MSQIERKTKINRTHTLPITQQCKLLSISRSSHYYKPREISDEELSLMRQLDELHLLYPFYGSRRLRNAMEDEHGLIVNRKRIRRLMRLMGIS